MTLVGIQPTKRNIRMRVKIKNGKDVPITVSKSTQAVLFSDGKRRTGIVSFGSAEIPANGELEGFITVPGHDLNPGSDVLIPNAIVGTSGKKSLHMRMKRSISLIPTDCRNGDCDK
jgi:hypothetical protein